jgi:hypothetical protein
MSETEWKLSSRDLESLYLQNEDTYPTETYLLQRQVERSILKIEHDKLRGEDRFVIEAILLYLTKFCVRFFID